MKIEKLPEGLRLIPETKEDVDLLDSIEAKQKMAFSEPSTNTGGLILYSK